MNPKYICTNHKENPFTHLNIDKCDILETIKERSACEKCHKSRKYFCYTCYLPVSFLRNNIPQIKLPIRIDIIKHCREIDGKSTAAHAGILAPENVFIYTYPNFPDISSDDKVVLIYPSKNAININQLFERTQTEKIKNYTITLPITRAIIIDSTWNQSKGIYKDPKLQALQCVVLRMRLSQFWRHQKGSPRWYLATIEALHQFLVELHESAWFSFKNNHQNLNDLDNIDPNSLIKGPYQGEYDNLLFFFKYMYFKIHKLYDHENLLSYKRPIE